MKRLKFGFSIKGAHLVGNRWICDGCGKCCGLFARHSAIADRERRRIRRAQARAIAKLRTHQHGGDWERVIVLASAIERCTSAPKKARTR